LKILIAKEVINEYINTTSRKLNKQVKSIVEAIPKSNVELPDYEVESSTESSSVPFATASPAYVPSEAEIGEVDTSGYNPFDNTNSVPSATGSPAYFPSNSPINNNNSSDYNVMAGGGGGGGERGSDLDSFFETLPENRKEQILSLPNSEDQKIVLQNIYNSLIDELIVSDTVFGTTKKVEYYKTHFTNPNSFGIIPKITVISCSDLISNSINRLNSKLSIDELNMIN